MTPRFGRTSTTLPSESACWSGWLLLTLASTWSLARWIELDFYCSLLSVEVELAQPSPVDRSVLFWLVWAKSLWVWFPALGVCGTLLLMGRQRLAWLNYQASLVLFCAWLIIDRQIQFTTGNHLHDYATFALDPSAWEWGGSGREQRLIKSALLLLTILAAFVLIATFAARHIGRLAARYCPARVLLASAACLSIAYILLVAGTALAPLVVSPRSTLLTAALQHELPGRPFWYPRVFGGETAANDVFAFELNRRLADIYAHTHAAIAAQQPIDQRNLLPAENRPHVVVLVLESLRHNIINQEVMPRLDALASCGLRCNRHYSSSNCSHFGLFSLLYGRSPLVYDQTLDADIPPQLPLTLRQAGYRTSFITSGQCEDWARMGEFLNASSFDSATTFNDGDWPARDRQALNRVRELIENSNGQPQFIIAFLMSTHYDYQFPPESVRFEPYVREINLLDPEFAQQREQVLNRYKNAAAFLDDEVGKLLDSLDLSQTLVAVTGDHGESILDDGTFAHGSRLSEIQTRVPLVFLGAGVPSTTVEHPTSHVDFVPTLLHLVAGRDVGLAHMHGVSALSPLHALDHTLLVQGGFDVMRARSVDYVELIRDDYRLRFMLHRQQPLVRFLGFRNTIGRPEFGVSVAEGDLQDVLANMTVELERLAGQTPQREFAIAADQ
jgi:phosphoglycerol transferase MdoB-like AlkP superfamily enzyme